VAGTAADSIETAEREGFGETRVVAFDKPDSGMKPKEEVDIETVRPGIGC
jgi:hypothetical protein